MWIVTCHLDNRRANRQTLEEAPQTLERLEKGIVQLDVTPLAAWHTPSSQLVEKRIRGKYGYESIDP